jgi:hypothetical protein
MTTVKTEISKGQKTATDLSALLRARNPLVWINTREEGRVESFLVEAAAAAGYKILFWDIAQGVTDIRGEAIKPKLGDTDVLATLNAIRTEADKGLPQPGGRPLSEDDPRRPMRQVWVFRDLPVWLDGGIPSAQALRTIRNLAKYLPSVPRSSAQAIIILTTSSKIPDDLVGHTTVIDWPLPDRSEIEKVLDSAINSLPEFDTKEVDGKQVPDETKPLRAIAAPNGVRDAVIDAAVGLTAEEAASCYAKSIVQRAPFLMSPLIDPALVAHEKKRVIKGAGLEWYDPLPGGLDAVGGLENVKEWLLERKSAYSAKAREYGLPAPKGIVLTGMSGCGKSLTAKAISTAWNCPLLRLDLNALKDKYMGQSEGNIRKMLNVITAIGRCGVWIDEIEKSLAGASSDGASDGGVAADALGTLLTWFQERTSEAFVIATANDVTALPPELLRKGRFDEVFFVDLPNFTERKAVLAAALRAHKRGEIKIDLDAVAEVTHDFTGAEIAELVPTALYAAFADKAREITTKDLLTAAAKVVPLSKTQEKKITALREWGKANARPATAAAKLEIVSNDGGRKIDF